MPKFGDQKDKIDFCWPDEQALKAMKNDQPVKIKSVTYRDTSNGGINQI